MSRSVVYTQICEHGKTTIRRGRPTEACGSCNKNSRIFGRSAYVENTTGFFNAGLGMTTYGTRDAEKKGKKLGLVCTGGEKLKPIPQPDMVTPILEEGIKMMRHRGEM